MIHSGSLDGLRVPVCTGSRRTVSGGRGSLLLVSVTVRGLAQIGDRLHDLLQGRHHVPVPLAAEAVGVRTCPVDLLEA